MTIKRTAKVASSIGLHARPAALFTRAVAGLEVPIGICRPGGEPVDASSILQVMSLGIVCGDEVELSTADEAQAQVLDELVTLLQTDLDATK